MRKASYGSESSESRDDDGSDGELEEFDLKKMAKSLKY